jgi:hypothetical protein
MAQSEGQAGQSASDAYCRFGTTVTARTKRHQIGQVVGLLDRFKGAKGGYVMNVMSVPVLR